MIKVRKSKAASEWSELSGFWKLHYLLLDLPLNTARKYSIPCFEENLWNRSEQVLVPLIALIVFQFLTQSKCS